MTRRLAAGAQWLGVQLRRLADARAATASLLGLVLATSFLFGAAPRLSERQAGDALRATVDHATADIRNVTVQQVDRIGEGPDPLPLLRADGDEFESQFPASVESLVAARYVAVDTPRFLARGLEARTVRLRYLEAATDHVHLTTGRFPTGATSTMPTPKGMPAGSTNLNRPLEPTSTLTTFEVALSTANATVLGVKVGDRLALSTDPSDKLANSSVAVIGIEVVGIFETNDANEDYWFADTLLDAPQKRSPSPTADIDDMTVLISGDATGPLLAATFDSNLPLRYSWRYQLDSSRLRAANVGVLLSDLRRMESVFVAISASSVNGSLGQPGSGPITLQTGLRMLISEYVASWGSVSRTLSVVEVGGGGVALLALGLICLLAGRRRGPSTALWLSRGASRGQFLAGLAAESLVVVIPAVAIGAAASVAAFPQARIEPTLLACGAVLVYGLGLLLWDGLSSGRDPAEAGGSTGVAIGSRARAAAGGRGIAALTRGASPRRLVLEAAVVAGAVAGAYLLRQRGVDATGADTVSTSPDPVSAAIPVLIGGAAALAAVRLLPLPLDAFSRLAERGRGLAAVLALRRATRRSNDRLLLTALLTMAAVWAFALASLSYLDRSASAGSWQEVGADYRLTVREGVLPPDLALDQVQGVEKVAYGAQLLAHVADQGTQVSVLSLDLPEYRIVAAGGWAEDLIPQSMLSVDSSASSASAGPATSQAIPIIVSRTFADEENLHVGDSIEIVLNSASVRLSVEEVLNSFPTLDRGQAWLVAGHRSLAASPAGTARVANASPLAPTEAFIRGDPSAAVAITQKARYRLPGQIAVSSRRAVESDLRSATGFSSVVLGLGVASLAVALYGALAVLAALLLSGAERSREAAHLHVLGLTRREQTLLSAFEHGPTSILMILAGILLGLGLFAFLLPGLGLGSLVGGQVDVGLSIEPAQVGLVGVAVCVIVGAAVGIETLAESIIEPVAALRRGLD